MANLFFRFMGVSGWLFIVYLIIAGIAFSPYNGGHWLLWLQYGIVAVIWLGSRWGTWIKNKYNKNNL